MNLRVESLYESSQFFQILKIINYQFELIRIIIKQTNKQKKFIYIYAYPN